MHVSLLIYCPWFESENQIYLWVGKKHQQLQRIRQAVAFNYKIFTVQQTIYLKSVKSRIFYRDTKSSSLDDAKFAPKLFFTNQRANNISFGLWLSCSHQSSNCKPVNDYQPKELEFELEERLLEAHWLLGDDSSAPVELSKQWEEMVVSKGWLVGGQHNHGDEDGLEGDHDVIPGAMEAKRTWHQTEAGTSPEIVWKS